MAHHWSRRVQRSRVTSIPQVLQGRGRIGSDQVVSCGHDRTVPVTPEAYGRQSEAYVHHDALDRAGKVEAPTLVVSGDHVSVSRCAVGGNRVECSPGAT